MEKMMNEYERVEDHLMKVLGLGKYKPKPSKQCPKCLKIAAWSVEKHADTGYDEFIWRCGECKYEWGED